MEKERYFLAVLLEGNDALLVNTLREEVAERFYVRAALRIFPHITLYKPFLATFDECSTLKMDLSAWISGMSSFFVRTPRFGYFGKRVAFLDIEPSSLLVKLKEKVEESVARNTEGYEREDRVPHFHITLAYKDVTPHVFSKIQGFLEERSVPLQGITIDHVALLKYSMQEYKWKVEHIFRFEKKTNMSSS